MHDKLLQSKAEIENAQKVMEKMKDEKKAQKQRIKLKSTVVLQQEQQIQQKQEHLDDQTRLMHELKRENDKKDLEAKDLNYQLTNMRTKLEEAS